MNFLPVNLESQFLKVLETKDLTKWYGKEVLALNKVSFQVDEGDFFVLIGPSGCGKSTLMKVIAGLLEYEGGGLYIKGQDMKNVPPHKRDISMMLENYALFPHMSVYNNIAFGLKMLGKDQSTFDKEVKDALKLVGMEGYERRSPLELSGGQRQRVAIARALVVNPAVLLLDEPLSHVDYRLQRKLMEEFKLLHQRLGTTFILTTHVQEHGLSLAETLMVMNTGVIEQIGKPAEIYAKPQTVFAARFVGDINLFRGEVSGRQGGVYVVKTELGEMKVAADAGKDYSGHTLAYGVRPEAIVVGDAALKCDNHLQAKGTNSYYFGNNVECIFEMQGGVTMRATVTPEIAPTVMHDGAMLGWSAHDAMLIEKPSVIEGLNIEEVIYGK
jgi:ABC-type Fe3+/spermidine/putrescine transport system ATPase subunit